MKRSLNHYYLSLLIFGVSFAVQGASAVYDETLRVLGNLKSTHYTHHSYVDESNGVYDFDCSAFAYYVVGNAFPKSATELDAAVYPKRPLARDFVNFFDSLKKEDGMHWKRVHYLRNLKKGDTVAWLIPPDSTSTDTGHVMLVTGKVRLNPEDSKEWFVPVTDAAVSGHGSTDPRKKDGPNGVGSGVIALIVAPTGMPTGFRWSAEQSTTVKYTKIRMARTLPAN